MAFIEVDPKQTKAVVALLVTLAGAIGYIVVRAHPPEQPAVAAQRVAVVSEKQSSARTREPAGVEISRNPFERPAGLPAPAKSSKASGIVTDETGPGASAELAPAAVGELPASGEVDAPRPFRSEKSERSTASARDDKSKPTFTLLATVRGVQGYSAVIRAGASVARVVEVGDVLEGGFKVKQVDSSRAVLTDGREIIVAKRPQS